MTSKTYDTFEELNTRLKEIVEAVGDESLPLDDALALYEEAVTLGLRASDLLEENIQEHEAQEARDADERPADVTAQGEAAAHGAADVQNGADALSDAPATGEAAAQSAAAFAQDAAAQEGSPLQNTAGEAQ
ncbi:MAG TPA: exodeoxyribonuclease VII small subunit [Candidatus Aphodovivens excrementavium]|nr:exodeoxyribonuclease VII small subunit [Candidatus Aphodovivens excrementavium]